MGRAPVFWDWSQIENHTPLPTVENIIWCPCAGARANIRLSAHGRLCHEDFSPKAKMATTTD